jgi:hypothetical protein
MNLTELIMKLKQLLQEKREEILKIAEKHGADNIRIFGSVARGEVVGWVEGRNPTLSPDGFILCVGLHFV